MKLVARAGKWLWTVTATLLIAVFVLFTAGPVVLPFVGSDLLAVRSGSMAPSIPTGSLVLSSGYSDSKAAQLPVGTVITFEETAHKSLVTHRIVEVLTEPSGAVAYRTKGDANGIVDTWKVAPEHVVGTPSVVMPGVGYAYVFLTSWPIRIGVALLVLFVAWGPRRRTAEDAEAGSAADVVVATEPSR